MNKLAVLHRSRKDKSPSSCGTVDENASPAPKTLETDNIYQGDSMTLIREVATESVHLILSDIPYGIGADEWDVLHTNTNTAYLGSSPAQKAAGAVFKKRGKPINGWSEADRAIPRQYQEWCSQWAPEWHRRPGASVFIFAGRRLAHRCVSHGRCGVSPEGQPGVDQVTRTPQGTTAERCV